MLSSTRVMYDDGEREKGERWEFHRAQIDREIPGAVLMGPLLCAAFTSSHSIACLMTGKRRVRTREREPLSLSRGGKHNKGNDDERLLRQQLGFRFCRAAAQR